MHVKDDGKHTVRIAPHAATPRQFTIEVQRPWSDGEATVNSAAVSCYGFAGTRSFSGGADEAEELAAALIEAAKIARRLDAEYKPQ